VEPSEHIHPDLFGVEFVNIIRLSLYGFFKVEEGTPLPNLPVARAGPSHEVQQPLLTLVIQSEHIEGGLGCIGGGMGIHPVQQFRLRIDGEQRGEGVVLHRTLRAKASRLHVSLKFTPRQFQHGRKGGSVDQHAHHLKAHEQTNRRGCLRASL